MAFLRVRFRTFVQATESEDKVRQAMDFILGDSELTIIRTEGHFGNPLLILEGGFHRSRDIRDFTARLKGTGIIEELLANMDDRMDENCTLHFRLDKALALEGKLALATNRNIIDCSLKTGAYPANKENAMETARGVLEALLGS